MKDLIKKGFVRKNNDGSVAPNVESLVEEELEGYDTSEKMIEQTQQKVMSRLA